jgi:DNA-binding MarR family transcriptional regulator
MKHFTLDESLGFVIARTHRALKMEVRHALHESGHDVTVEQWGVLCRLYERDGRSHKELADSLCKDTPTITRMIDSMVERGQVYRKRDTNDRRVYQVYLTDEGRRLWSEIEPIFLNLVERCFSFLDSKEQQSLKNLLERIREHLEQG